MNIKQRIFSLYLGQGKKFLVVKPLFKMTDEEAVELIKMKISYEYDLNYIEDIQISEKSWDKKRPFTLNVEAIIKCKGFADFVERIFISPNTMIPYFMIDYLRFKGYITPIFGYTVEQLIDEGIFVIET